MESRISAFSSPYWPYRDRYQNQPSRTFRTNFGQANAPNAEPYGRGQCTHQDRHESTPALTIPPRKSSSQKTPSGTRSLLTRVHVFVICEHPLIWEDELKTEKNVHGKNAYDSMFCKATACEYCLTSVSRATFDALNMTIRCFKPG